MIGHVSNRVAGTLLTAVVACLLNARPAAAQARDRLDVSQIPERVIGALRARFPGAEIQKWTKEKEGNVVLYDIEFTHQRRRFEADIKEDGTFHNWEREVAAEDLPETVRQTLRGRYPGSRVKVIMAITEVRGGTGMLAGYEIVLQTADGNEVEITVAPNGTILEDSMDEP
jgi:uncharacterized membrane protein YkoI